MPTEMLSLAEAAERLGVRTYDVVVMVHHRRIEYVLVDGLARIPETVVEELLRQKAS